MDAFYASVELLRYPQLTGLPVVIGGSRRQAGGPLTAEGAGRPMHDIPLAAFERLGGYAGRGVITTATYAARQFGVGSAMGLMKAARLCPQAVLLPADFDAYRDASRRFKAVVTALAPAMEDRGVDEVYIDFTAVQGGQEEGGRVLAALLQARIFEATGLTCSIGVAPNKLLAKMASEFNKPSGISVLHEAGPKAGEKLALHGIHTIGELAQKTEPWLVQHFGRATGAWLHASAWGRDARPVVTESEPVSMGRETTFERDLHAVQDRAELGQIFTALCERVAADLQRKGYAGKTVGIKLRYADFSTVTRDLTLGSATDDAATVRRTAGLCLKRAPLTQRLRLLGVRVAALSRAATPAPGAAQAAAAQALPRQRALF